MSQVFAFTGMRSARDVGQSSVGEPSERKNMTFGGGQRKPNVTMGEGDEAKSKNQTTNATGPLLTFDDDLQLQMQMQC